MIRKIIFLLLILLMFFILMACPQKKEGEKPTTTPVQKQEKQEKDDKKEKKEDKEKQKEEKEEKEEKELSSPTPSPTPLSRILKDKEAFYLPLSQNEILPQDFEMGPLQDLRKMSLTSEEIVKLTRQFLQAVEKKSDLSVYFLPDFQDSLKHSLDYTKDIKVPFSSRMSEIIYFSEESASANVRVKSKETTIYGEILYEKSEKDWYISDVQINFNLLQAKESILVKDMEEGEEKEQEEKEKKEKFEPGIYHFYY